MADQGSSANNHPNTDAAMPPTGIPVASPVVADGFKLPVVTFQQDNGLAALKPVAPPPATSTLAAQPAITQAELVELSTSTGKLLYYPKAVAVNQGDVFYLRERDAQGKENGLIVEVIEKGTAGYGQVDQKVIFRLLTAVRAHELDRVHHEPPETIDMFLSATFMVRAAIVDGKWSSSGGQVVTRNVDLFSIDPKILLRNIIISRHHVNIDIGIFHDEPVIFSGEGFDKVNLITGMKNGGKSHTAKGIIDESRKRGMSAVVFDMNGEYENLPSAKVFRPTVDVKFRLDRMEPYTFIEVIRRLAPFAKWRIKQRDLDDFVDRLRKESLDKARDERLTREIEAKIRRLRSNPLTAQEWSVTTCRQCTKPVLLRWKWSDRSGENRLPAHNGSPASNSALTPPRRPL